MRLKGAVARPRAKQWNEEVCRTLVKVGVHHTAQEMRNGTATRICIMDITTLLIIVVVLLLLGGGGWYGRGRWFGR